jgi:hypothetical protein
MPGTFTITSDSVSSTPLDTNIILKTVAYTTAPLVYEPPQYDANTGWPRQGIFALSDADHQIFLYDGYTNSAIAPGPAGANGGGPITFNIPVGALYVRGCPTNAVWTIVTEAAPPGTIFPDWSHSSVFDQDPVSVAAKARDAAIIAAERIRTARPPPTSVELMRAAGEEVKPPPPPPEPDPALLKAYRTAAETFTAEKAARDTARGPTVVGKSQTEIEMELVGVVHAQQLADRHWLEVSNARAEAGQKLADQRAAEQAEATRLLAAMQKV